MASDRLTVGLPVSQSGQFSLQGEQVLAGIQRWIRWVNRRGGVTLDTGQQLPVELCQYDDESRPAAAERLSRRLIQEDEVDILLGPYSSRLTLAAAPVADAHETVLWNHSGATDALYEEGFQWLVSILAPANSYFHGLLDLIQQVDPSASRIAVCWSTSGSFGSAVASGAIAHARTSGYSDITEHAWEPPLDAPSLVDSVQETDPDLVLTAGSFEDDVRFVRELLSRDSPPKTNAIGAVAAGISAFSERLGGIANSVFGPSQWEPVPGVCPEYGPSSADVIDWFEDTDQATEYPAIQAFATGIVIERCLAAGAANDPTTEAVDQQQLRNAADTADFTTFYGRFRIDSETGKQIGHTPVIVQWQADEKRIVWTENETDTDTETEDEDKDQRSVEPLYPLYSH